MVILIPFIESRCLDDTDDEVRDRAAMALALLENAGLAKEYLKDGNGRHGYDDTCRSRD